MKKSVGAVIFYKNLYLIQKRSLKKNIYFPGLYGVFGGNVNKLEKSKRAIIREIKEELDINLNYDQAQYFLKISINSKHFKKNRVRFYYSLKITEEQLNSMILKEGESLHLINIQKIKKLEFVPWDLSAILYFNYFIRKKRTVKPQ